MDSDKDGAHDHVDKCPDTPFGVAVDANGCPLEAAKKFCDKPTVLAIVFEANKSEIRAKYYVELDKLGTFLKEFTVSKGVIEGHTDSDGSKEANLKLSQARAESVRNYIVKKFEIPVSRISAKGFGSAKPVSVKQKCCRKSK